MFPAAGAGVGICITGSDCCRINIATTHLVDIDACTATLFLSGDPTALFLVTIPGYDMIDVFIVQLSPFPTTLAKDAVLFNFLDIGICAENVKALLGALPRTPGSRSCGCA